MVDRYRYRYRYTSLSSDPLQWSVHVFHVFVELLGLAVDRALIAIELQAVMVVVVMVSYRRYFFYENNTYFYVRGVYSRRSHVALSLLLGAAGTAAAAACVNLSNYKLFLCLLSRSLDCCLSSVPVWLVGRWISSPYGGGSCWKSLAWCGLPVSPANLFCQLGKTWSYWSMRSWLARFFGPGKRAAWGLK